MPTVLRRIPALAHYTLFCGMLVAISLSSSAQGAGNCNDIDMSSDKVSMRDLLAAPGKYQGVFVEVVGLYAFAHPNGYLFADVDDLIAYREKDFLTTRAVMLQLNPNRVVTMSKPAFTVTQFGLEADRRMVKARGRFTNRVSHGAFIVQVIENVQTFEVCTD